MLVETNVTTVLVLLGRQLKMVWAAIAAMVTVAAAVFSLTGSLVSLGAAGPLAGPDVTGRDEEGASFGAGE